MPNLWRVTFYEVVAENVVLTNEKHFIYLLKHIFDKHIDALNINVFVDSVYL